MIDYTVTPMFSTPIFHTNIGAPDPITLNWIKKLDYPHEASGHDHTEDKYILDRPQMKNLKAKLKSVTDYWIHEVLGVQDDLNYNITNSWINRHRKGEMNTIHWHSNAVMSCVYYPQTPPNSGAIIWKRSHMYYNLFHDTLRPEFKDTHSNQFNTDIHVVEPVSGDLVMFPSQLEHVVPPSDSDEERYSLAFNLFPRGTFGAGTSSVTV
jgi:uncharacterized protein (TIGR02466 family)